MAACESSAVAQPASVAAAETEQSLPANQVAAFVPEWLHDDSWLASSSRPPAAQQPKIRSVGATTAQADTSNTAGPAVSNRATVSEGVHESATSGRAPQRPTAPPSAAMQALEALIPPPFLNSDSDSDQLDSVPQSSVNESHASDHPLAAHRPVAQARASDYTPPSQQPLSTANEHGFAPQPAQPPLQTERFESDSQPASQSRVAEQRDSATTGLGFSQQSGTTAPQPSHQALLQPQPADNRASGADADMHAQQVSMHDQPSQQHAVPQASVLQDDMRGRVEGQAQGFPQQHERVQPVPEVATPFSTAAVGESEAPSQISEDLATGQSTLEL